MRSRGEPRFSVSQAQTAMKKKILVAAILVAGIYLLRSLAGLDFPLPYLDIVTGERHWSISIYRGDDPFRFFPLPAGDVPALATSSVTDFPCSLVADPFLARDNGRWYLFFEAMNADSGRGVIALAESSDGLNWDYAGTVLEAPFHLSYPYVFRAGENWHMIPESAAGGEVALYRAAEFPRGWVKDTVLLDFPLKDPSPLRYGGTWYLFAADSSWSLRLFSAPELRGPWSEHPRSPVVKCDRSRARPGGRMILWEGRPVRYAQDCARDYGSAVRAFVIETLTPENYAEREAGPGPVIAGTGRGWNARGMHQVDALEISPGKWLAAVDGYPPRGKKPVIGFGPTLRAR